MALFELSADIFKIHPNAYFLIYVIIIIQSHSYGQLQVIE